MEEKKNGGEELKVRRKEQKVGGDQREIKGRVKSLGCVRQHTHEHPSTVSCSKMIIQPNIGSYSTEPDGDL